MYACDCFLFLSVIHVDTAIRPLEFSPFRPRSGACALFITHKICSLCACSGRVCVCVCVRAILSHPQSYISEVL